MKEGIQSSSGTSLSRAQRALLRSVAQIQFLGDSVEVYRALTDGEYLERFPCLHEPSSHAGRHDVGKFANAEGR
jgi:hypothetical protein